MRFGVVSTGMMSCVVAMCALAPRMGAQYAPVPAAPPCAVPAPSLPPSVADDSTNVGIALLALDLDRTAPEVRYLADAYPEALGRQLALSPSVRLVSRLTLRRLPLTSTGAVRATARGLGVRWLIAGSISTSGNGSVLRLRLYDTTALSATWERTVAVTPAALHAALPEMAAAIGARLRVASDAAAQGRWRTAPTRDAEAFVSWLRGLDEQRELTVAHMATSLRFLDAAGRKDPTFAAAHVAIADAYLGLLDAGDRQALANPDSIVRLAVAAAQRAVAIAPAHGEAQATLGRALARARGPQRQALAAFTVAGQAAPRDPFVGWAHAEMLMHREGRDAAYDVLLANLRRSPRHAPTLMAMGQLALLDGNERAACGWFNATLATDPFQPTAYALRAIARRRLDDVRLSWADAEAAQRLGARAQGEAAAALADAANGDSTRARSRVLKLFREYDRRPTLSAMDAYLVGLALTTAGEGPRAVSLLTRSYPQDGLFRAMLGDPGFRELAKDPRFVALRSRISPAAPTSRTRGEP